MMMTACDLNGTTKPWEIQKEVCQSFFTSWICQILFSLKFPVQNGLFSPSNDHCSVPFLTLSPPPHPPVLRKANYEVLQKLLSNMNFSVLKEIKIGKQAFFFCFFFDKANHVADQTNLEGLEFFFLLTTTKCVWDIFTVLSHFLNVQK